MQRKDLALRVLSTAAIMSIVTSIAAPAFADIYYIGNGSIDVVTKEDADGKKYVEVKQGDKTYTDTSDEIVIKDGNNEGNAAQKEESRIEGKKAKVAIPDGERTDTQELEAAGSADAAGESQPDPDAGFTLSETEENSEEGNDPTDNPTEKPTENPTDDPTANPKKDVVYQYGSADPEPEKQATKPAPAASADPAAKTPETTLADASATAPTPATPAEGSAAKPTKNVIKVINNWAEKVLNIRLSNVNIESDKDSTHADGKTDTLGSFHGASAAEVQGSGNTKIELDGQNVLDSSKCYLWAGLNKKDSGNLTITDETRDTGETITAKEETDHSGSLRAEGGYYYSSHSGSGGSAAIGGSWGQATDNITIEGYATVKANTKGYDATGIGGGCGEKGSNITIQGHANVTADGGWYGAGIGGGSDGWNGGGDAENIIIRGYSKVTATAREGAAIGSGAGESFRKAGDAKNIVICDHATVVAKSIGDGAAIGTAGNGREANAVVTIGTEGFTAEQEDVHITATSKDGSAIGNGKVDTKVTIQGHVTIQTASASNSSAIGSKNGNVTVNIKDNASIDTATGVGASGIGGGLIWNDSGRTVKVNIDGGEHGKVKLGENSAITGGNGAISGTEVKIGNNVLLKMKGKNGQYIRVNNAEAAVGKRNDPAAGGLVNTIGNNTELWYTDYNGVLQKIVHSKNLCTEELVDETPATCTTPGSKTYKCTFESNKGAASPEHTETRVETTNALGHDFTVKQSETPATCERAGTIVWKCSRCDETKTETIPATGHHWTDNGDNSTHICVKGDATEAHSYGEWTTVTEATCTTAGKKQHTCTVCGHVETQEIPATGHHWKDNGDGTHTCPDCGATEGQPFNTNSALELRVVDAEGMNQPFTVSQNGTLRTYTGAYDTATLTGDLDTLRYLQDHGAQTIQFVTNGQTSSFAISDLLAQGSGSEVFYLTHRGAEEPTLLLVEADRSDLVKD